MATSFNLYTVLNRVKQIITQKTEDKSFWVRAQVSKSKQDRRGNYYLELIESKDGNVIAKCDALLWYHDFKILEEKLKEDTPKILGDGSEILILARIEYSEIYGFRLQILDIDLTYSLGEIERRKQHNLLYLKQNGLLHLNKTVKAPAVFQNIALVGSPNTSGYADFIKHLLKNTYNYKFNIEVFPCAVQGERALNEIKSAIEFVDFNKFDCIVLIRGGGSKFDLDIFNDLELSKKIATSKLPVLTGIGHETDYCVADEVAFSSFKTPTAVAAYLIDKTHAFDLKILNLQQNIKNLVITRINSEDLKLQKINTLLKNKTFQSLQNKQHLLQTTSSKISYVTQQLVHQQKLKLSAKTDFVNFKAKKSIQNQFNFLQEAKQKLSLFSDKKIKDETKSLELKPLLLKHYVKAIVQQQKLKLEHLEQIPKLYSPQNILNLGYGIVRKNGKVLNENSVLKPQDELDLELASTKYKILIDQVTSEKKWNNILTKEQLQN